MEFGPGPNMAVTIQILTLVATVLVSATLIPGIGAAETKLTKQVCSLPILRLTIVLTFLTLVVLLDFNHFL